MTNISEAVRQFHKDNRTIGYRPGVLGLREISQGEELNK
jgi:hypothetical protein